MNIEAIKQKSECVSRLSELLGCAKMKITTLKEYSDKDIEAGLYDLLEWRIDKVDITTMAVARIENRLRKAIAELQKLTM